MAHGRRLIFADLLADIPAYLARTARASLLVDTPEYNLHTTGSDGLWSGVPMLTISSETMASRVGGSLLHSSGQSVGRSCSLREYQRVARELTLNERERTELTIEIDPPRGQP